MSKSKTLFYKLSKDELVKILVTQSELHTAEVTQLKDKITYLKQKCKIEKARVHDSAIPAHLQRISDEMQKLFANTPEFRGFIIEDYPYIFDDIVNDTLVGRLSRECAVIYLQMLWSYNHEDLLAEIIEEFFRGPELRKLFADLSVHIGIDADHITSLWDKHDVNFKTKVEEYLKNNKQTKLLLP